MKAIVCEEPNRLRLTEEKIPVRNNGEALLSIKRIGICGTDLHAFKGNQPFFNYPRILGHELAAKVLSIDSNTAGLKEGDQVVVVPYINCQECTACRSGKTNCCENIQVFGVHTDGGMKEQVVLPTRLLMKANHLSLDEIAIVEPLAIGAHAIRRSNVKQGDTVVVMGCGPIGIGIIQLCKYLGAEVIALDVNDHRLSTVKGNFQADHTINVTDSPIEKIKAMTNGELALHVFDATGNKKALESGTDYMRHGGNYTLVGLYKGELNFLHPKIHAKETTLMCSRNATPEDFELVMKVLAEKRFNVSDYITKQVDFSTIATDMDQWADPSSKEIKVMAMIDS